MTPSPRENLKQALAEKLFSAMLGDLIMDSTLLAHKESKKRQAKQDAYGLMSANSSQSVSLKDNTSPSQTNGATAVSQKQEPALLDCLNCNRPIAFNRYAPHLASCMGLNVGARRGQPRNASKRLDSEGARSASPQVGEDREGTPSGSKSAGKRNRSPSETSVRDAKRSKIESGRGTPQPKTNGAVGVLPGHYANSVPKASSKLRSSPVGSQGVSGSPAENSYDSDYNPSQQQSIVSDSNSVSQPSADGYNAEDKDPEYVIDVDGTVDTESDSDTGSE